MARPRRVAVGSDPGAAGMMRLAFASACLLLIWHTRPAAAAMEHEEIVARLATGQCVPSYETRACRKLRRMKREARRWTN